MHIFYLHGFASSAKSTKARYFESKLAPHDLTLFTPDFNEPDFSTLTITRMIDQTTAAIEALPEGPVVLVGSSLGGFVAVQTALKHQGLEIRARRPIERLVLLAPALEFGGDRMRDFGDRGLHQWKTTGQSTVFHYAYGRLMPMHYELYSDACRYDCAGAALTLPIQVFQGKNDTVVDPWSVERWASARPNVELHLLEDDHQLVASLDRIWAEMKRFIF